MHQLLVSSITRATTLLALALMPLALADPATTQNTEKAAEPSPAKKAFEALKFPGLTVNTELRCVDVDATICLDKGSLELVACTKKTKEHESLVVVDARPLHIHTALLLLGAKNGSPASRRIIDEETRQWEESPPAGDTIEVFLVVKNAEGKMIERPVSDFITRNDDPQDAAVEKSADEKKAEKFPATFLFAGSLLLDEGKTPREYLADTSGSVISISTFGDELLCLPGLQSQENGALMWEINSNEIPVKDTKVILRLRPQKNVPKK